MPSDVEHERAKDRIIQRIKDYQESIGEDDSVRWNKIGLLYEEVVRHEHLARHPAEINRAMTEARDLMRGRLPDQHIRVFAALDAPIMFHF